MTQATSTAVIRPRRDEDIPGLAAALIEVHAVDGYPVEGVAHPEAWLRLDNLIGVWTAEIDGQPVGHVALTEPGPGDDAARIWHEQTGTPLDTLAVLGRLFVAPTARDHALGRRLTQVATKAAHDSGRGAVLDVMNKDTAAIHTYETLGWTHFADIQHNHSAGKKEPGRATSATRASRKPRVFMGGLIRGAARG